MSTADSVNEAVRARKHGVQQITTHTDSREILANARRDIDRYHLRDYFIVDVDAHHVEFDSWSEILDHLQNPVLRHNAKAMAENWPRAKELAFSNHVAGLTFQDVFGRIPHQAALAEDVKKAPNIGTLHSFAAPWIPWESKYRWYSLSRCWRWVCIRSRISRRR